MVTQNLKLDAIIADSKLQMREQVSDETVTDYKDAMSLNVKFPALRVVKVDGMFYLVDGFHRYKAALAAKGKDDEVECVVTEGTMEDAILEAAGANQTNGLRRTNADKRKAVTSILMIERFRGMAPHKIAERIGVSTTLVGEVKKELSSHGVTMPDKTVATRNGKTYATKAKQVKKPKVKDGATTAQQVPKEGSSIASDDNGDKRDGKTQFMETSALGKSSKKKQVLVSDISTDNKAKEYSVVPPQTPIPTTGVEKAPIGDAPPVDMSQSTQAPVPAGAAKKETVSSLMAAIKVLQAFMTNATDEEISSVRDELYSIEKLIKTKLATLDHQDEK